MTAERATVLVRMPAELKRRLRDEVVARGANLNDIAVEILATRFAVEFETSGRRSVPKTDGDVLLRLPRALKEKLAVRPDFPGVNRRPRLTGPDFEQGLCRGFVWSHTGSNARKGNLLTLGRQGRAQSIRAARGESRMAHYSGGAL